MSRPLNLGVIMSSVLYPTACPFCHSSPTQTEELELDFGRWAVVCAACGATGPLTASPDAAIVQWNGCSPSPNVSSRMPPP
jgi:hypothetical protein